MPRVCVIAISLVTLWPLARVPISAAENRPQTPAGKGVAPGADAAPTQPDSMRMAARIDELLAAAWAKQGIDPAPRADDAEFQRRLHLDLTGVIPTVAEARAFLEDADPNKRSRLIDRLLDSQLHADHMATAWRNMMVPRGATVDGFDGQAGLQSWLRGQFKKNQRYDRMVADLLIATGAGQEGPALFYTAFELKPEELAANSARVFLGVQLECAQCHNHPFDRWTQQDFWGYAAFFARLERGSADRPGRAMRLIDSPEGEVKLPGTETVVLPRYPRGDAADATEGGTRRMQLGIWMVSRDNPFLGRAAANRLWAHMFGRGLVEPVDDLADHNPASHPQLFDELAAYFVESGFDVRNMLRTLANTRAYQLTSRTSGVKSPPVESLARMPLRTLSAEQFYDSLLRAGLLRPTDPTMYGPAPPGNFDVGRQQFVAKVQAQGRSPLDYELGVVQVLLLLNGPEVWAATGGRTSGLIAALDAPIFTDQERVEVAFLATLSRLPTANERTRCLEHLSRSGAGENRKQALGDLLWALANSAEFAFNH